MYNELDVAKAVQYIRIWVPNMTYFLDLSLPLYWSLLFGLPSGSLRGGLPSRQFVSGIDSDYIDPRPLFLGSDILIGSNCPAWYCVV